MGLTLDALVFDPTGPSEGANVGAFLRDSAGNLLTSTLIGGTHQALDVNVANAIQTTPEADVAPATANITAQDTGSSSASGANGQAIITGSATAGSTAAFSFATVESLRVQVTGTWTGTLTSEISLDGGTTWYQVNVVQNTVLTAASFSANFEGATGVTGATNWRLRATAAWTGTATVKVIESVNSVFTYIGNALRLVDATSSNEATIKAASTAAVAADPSLVVALSPNSPLPTGANTIGAVTQGTTPWVDNLTQVGGSAISLGQKVSASSFPVVLASDQSSIPVAATQSGTWTVQQGTPPWSVDGNVADNAADAGNPVKDGTRSSFGAALSAVTATNNRVDMISDRYRRLFVSGSADVGVLNTQVSVGTSAITLLATQKQGRRKIYIQNNSKKATVYLGHDNTVTSSNGLSVGAGAVFEDEIGEDVAVWIIADTAATDVRVYELA